MAIIKNEIPILEYDDSQLSVLMPNHDKLNLQLPKKAVFAFLGSHTDEYANKHNCEIVAKFESATKVYPIYLTHYQGHEICLCQAPVGSAPATQILDWLISYGVKEVISAGSCGALIDIPENTFLVPKKALRDEGTSYHYLPPSRYVELNPIALKAIEQTLNKHNYSYIECLTWSTDGFFRETKDKVEYRRSEGCSVVEMECSSLAACSEFRNIIFGQILFTADTLADINNYDMRGWGGDSFEIALSLCLDAVINLG
ncbi:nucleoside phosphorylase [Turicibacter sanguinis]|uniref:nucleoside phosphorylase n=1 Tax=Turicibacter sanguinis TaxID=154288 RepID=UPI0012BB59A7|nr:phosphorylase [Turicibacter sanguinis]MTN50629.1 phosphorylase [Turicibacter sanguinis]MTN53722.1 phosphorylase [Turicibacter sanguinis]MTN56912.1 phosphorylase [Turicibacter sanguinis]MTN59977.1 phosphorylase [Turicibacter sanguinis]